MNNSYKIGLAAIAASLALVGCGGSSDSSPTTGTSFYIDNEVNGANYTCGTQKGITDADGKFTFDVGSSCTFTLGTIKLRDVNAEELFDGASFYEKNDARSSVLLGLDTDNDPSNGIQINAEIVAAMEEAGITEIPDTQVPELEDIKDVIVANGGTYVTLEEAQAHLDETAATALKSLLAGKILYGQSDYTAWEFNEDLTSVYVIDVDAGTDTVGETVAITLEGTTIIADGGATTIEAEIGGQSITLTWTSGTDTGMTDTLYYDLAELEAYYDGIAITEEMLSGKTFYHYQPQTSFEDEIYAKMTLSGAVLTRTEVINGGAPDTFTVSYAIIDGKIRIDVPAMDGDPATYIWWTLLSETADSWTLKDEEDQGQDATIDFTDELTLYLSKPADYPTSL